MIENYEKIGKSYRSLGFKDPKELYFNNYWSHERNHSTIDEQVTNVEEKYELIFPYIHHTDGRLLEIACAPGTLMGKYEEKRCHGIEIDPKYHEDILRHAPNASLHFGFFPEITDGWDIQFREIVACDVLEHVENPLNFLIRCRELLEDGGYVIMQLPLLLTDEDEKEEWYFNCPEEHIWIHHIDDLMKIISAAGMKVDKISRWKTGHEQIVLRKVI